ncbi:MAG: phosphatidylserine decarboxylase [Chlamydiales bacterium]
MKDPIYFINRETGKKEEEKIFYESTLRFLYNSRIGQFFAIAAAKVPLFSYLYGWWQQRSFSKRKIASFVERYEVNPSEFEKSLDQFTSFNDFFSRRLKAEARPIKGGENSAIIPADGRYLFYQQIDQCDGFIIKGKKFSVESLLNDAALAKRYEKGSLVIARLCPADYHRFHFPCDCTPEPAKLIKGSLYSVNPISIKQKIDRLTENKRMLAELKTAHFGTLLYIEVGATCVGSIHQTYSPYHPYRKGDEKGYFSFGGSTLILLFEPNRIRFDEKLTHYSAEHVETRCLLGQTLGNVYFSSS